MESVMSIQQKLEELKTVFSQSAISCIEAMFGKKCEVHMPWEVVEQLQAQFDVILSMGSASKENSAIICAGIQYDSLRALLGEENVSPEYASDVLGEFVNTYCAMLDDNADFRKHFGILTQAPPVLYTDGHSWLPFVWGIQGYIYFNNNWIYIGYSVRSNTNDSEESGSFRSKFLK